MDRHMATQCLVKLWCIHSERNRFTPEAGHGLTEWSKVSTFPHPACQQYQTSFQRWPDTGDGRECRPDIGPLGVIDPDHALYLGKRFTAMGQPLETAQSAAHGFKWKTELGTHGQRRQRMEIGR